MSIIDTLITNRTKADVDALRALYAKPKAMWTADEWNEFLLGNHRGAYNASDMNRVLDALDYLAERVTEFGYRKPKIKRPSITEVIPGTSRLPEGYTELEYIRSTGEQYIDTEFAPNQDSRVVFRGEFPITADTQWLFGSRVGNGSAMFGFLEYQSQFRFDYGTTNNYFNNADTVTSVDTNKNNVVVNGSETLSAASQTFSSGYNLLLFANNNAGTVSGHATDAKCSGCQIYDNDTLVREYVPCLNLFNEVGLYDIVNGLFYGNAGTGSFIAGPEAEWSGTITEIVIRDYYKIGDCPPVSELGQYLDNVTKVRAVLPLPDSVPAVPADTAALTVEEANHIEIILTAVEALLNRISLSWFYSGEIYSGEV